MLHIIKQFAFGLKLNLKSEFQGSSELQQASNNLDASNDALKNMTKSFIKDYLKNTVDKNTDKNLSAEELNNQDIPVNDLKNLLKKLDIDVDTQESFPLEEVLKKLENYGVEVEEVVKVSQKESTKLKTELSDGGEGFDEKKSGNFTLEGTESEYFQEVQEDLNNLFDNIDITSAQSIFRQFSPAEVVEKIESGLDKKKEIIDKGTDIEREIETLIFNGLEKSSGEKWLEKNGYNDDGFFGAWELKGIHSYAVKLNQNQKLAQSNNSQQKFAQLVDFDMDGMLETEKNFYMGELQAEYLDKTDSVGSFENLYENLGLNQEELETEMINNFFTAHEKFQQRLGTFLKMGVKPGELFVKGGLSEVLNKLYAETKDKLETVQEQEGNILFIQGAVKSHLENKIDGGIQNIDEVSETIALEGIHFLVGGAKGVAANFNIAKLTDDIIDNLGVGYVEGQPGFVLSKKFFEGTAKSNDLQVTGGLANIVVPFVSASVTLIEDNFTSSEVINATGDDYAISGFASVSTIGKVVGLQYNESSHETSMGIENMGTELGKQLDEMIEALSDDENAKNPVQLSTENSDLNQEQVDAANKLYDNYFSVLQNIEKNITGNTKEKAYFENAKNAIVDGYKERLYRYQDGELNFSSVGAGVVLIADFAPIPFLTANFEHIHTHFNEHIHSNERERGITEKTSNLNAQSVEIIEYKGKNVLQFDSSYSVSVPENYPLQAEIVGENLYIGGQVQSIRIHEHVGNEGVTKTIVINDGSLTEDGLYIHQEKGTPITDTLNFSSEQKIQSNIIEVVNNTQDIRANINTLFSYDTLMSEHTVGAIALQREIFDYVNGDQQGDIKDVFATLKTFVGSNGFLDYVNDNEHNKEWNELKSQLDNFTSENSQEYLAIIQSVNANFMEKGELSEEDGVVKMKQSMREYDNGGNELGVNRGDFFDSVFEEKYGSEFAQNIKTARELYISQNGDIDEYKFVPSEGNLAQTGVMLGSKGKGVMSYEGVYNLAKPVGGVSEIPMENNPAYINSLPNNFVKNIQSQLLSVGIQLDTLDEVKQFINDGGNDIVTVDYQIAFARMGECLNDAIVLKEFNITAPNNIMTSLTSTVNMQTEDIMNVGVTLLDIPKTTTGDDQDSTPGVEIEGGDQDSTPGYNLDSDITDSNGAANPTDVPQRGVGGDNPTGNNPANPTDVPQRGVGGDNPTGNNPNVINQSINKKDLGSTVTIDRLSNDR